MLIKEIVYKLVGEIVPVGDTRIDEIRFENLKELLALMDDLLHDLNQVAILENRPEASLKKAAKYINYFFIEHGMEK